MLFSFIYYPYINQKATILNPQIFRHGRRCKRKLKTLQNFVPNSLFKGFYGDGWSCLSTLAQKNQSKRLVAASKNDCHCRVCVCVYVCVFSDSPATLSKFVVSLQYACSRDACSKACSYFSNFSELAVGKSNLIFYQT